MNTQTIYKELEKVTDGIWNYQDQMLAIARWIDEEFVRKARKSTLVNEFYPFEEFWKDYDKKVGDKDKLMKKWAKVSLQDRRLIKAYIPLYKLAQSEKRYRKNPETFINNKSWNDELITDKTSLEARRESVTKIKDLASQILTGDKG